MLGIGRRWALDALMVLGLVVCMCGVSLGAALHEWLGLAVLLLFVWHFLWNRGWLASLGRGRWQARRVWGTVLDGLLCFFALGLLVSSVMLSKVVFGFLGLHLADGVGLTPHSVCAYWGFLVAALHFGSHGGAAGAVLKKCVVLSEQSWRVLAGAGAFLGAWAFMALAYAKQLIPVLTAEHVQSGPVDFAGYAFIFVLWACIGSMVARGLLSRRVRRMNDDND